jgi:putative nucleotidyltransferase with HDIG domain
MAIAEAQAAPWEAATPTRPQPVRHRGAGRRLLEAFEAFERFPVFVGAQVHVIDAQSGYRLDSDMTAAIESDLALTVAVLRRVNRDLGTRDQVATIPRALALLDPHELRRIVAGAPSFDLFGHSGPWGGAPLSHRLHAVATQRAAARIAGEILYDRADELYVAALLHDVGKLVLGWADSRYSSLDGAADLSPERRIELERREMGVDHAVVGGVLARRWGLPRELAHAIERHHDPADTGLAGMVRLADMIARFEAGNPVSPARMRDAAGNLGLSAPALRSLLTAAPTGEKRSVVPSPLTRGEQRVLSELGKGLVYKQIAQDLCLSVSTVRTHLYNVYRKLDVSDRAQAILLAKANNWI